MEYKFVIPYIDQPLSFWQDVKETYGSFVKEIYFPLSQNAIGSGRPHQAETHLSEFLESGLLPVSALINPIILPEPIEQLQDKIISLLHHTTQNSDLTGVTLSNITLATIVRKEFPELEITASTLMDIFSQEQVLLVNGIVDTIVPASRIVRNIQALNELRLSFMGKIRLLVNESCLPGCLFRTQHFYEMTKKEIEFPKSLCNELLENNQWLRLTGSWILPQHLSLFEGLYDEIKLAGRVSLNDPEKYLKVLAGYINESELLPNEIGGGPASVLIPCEIEKSFYEETLTCNKSCATCDYCRNYYKLQYQSITANEHK